MIPWHLLINTKTNENLEICDLFCKNVIEYCYRNTGGAILYTIILQYTVLYYVGTV